MKQKNITIAAVPIFLLLVALFIFSSLYESKNTYAIRVEGEVTEFRPHYAGPFSKVDWTLRVDTVLSGDSAVIEAYMGKSFVFTTDYFNSPHKHSHAKYTFRIPK